MLTTRQRASSEAQWQRQIFQPPQNSSTFNNNNTHSLSQSSTLDSPSPSSPLDLTLTPLSAATAVAYPVGRPVMFFDVFASHVGRREMCGFDNPVTDFRRCVGSDNSAAAVPSDSDSSSVVDYERVPRRGLLDLDLIVPPPPEIA